MRGELDVRRLRQVLAIHAAGSFGRAAAQLGIAQPTLSKSISRLEDELGLQLFERTHDGAVVTPMGALLVARAERICRDAGSLSREVQLLAAGEVGEVRLGVGPALAYTLLPALATAIAVAFPKLRLRFTVAPRRELLASLDSGALDALLVANAADLQANGLEVFQLASDITIAVASPDHPLAGSPSISLAEFARHASATIGVSGTFIPRAVLKLPVGEDDGPLNAYSANDTGIILALARSGVATAVGMSQIFDADIAAGRLCPLNLPIDYELQIVMAMTAATSASPVLQRLVEISHRVARDVIGHRGAPAQPACP